MSDDYNDLLEAQDELAAAQSTIAQQKEDLDRVSAEREALIDRAVKLRAAIFRADNSQDGDGLLPCLRWALDLLVKPESEDEVLFDMARRKSETAYEFARRILAENDR